MQKTVVHVHRNERRVRIENLLEISDHKHSYQVLEHSTRTTQVRGIINAFISE